MFYKKTIKSIFSRLRDIEYNANTSICLENEHRRRLDKLEENAKDLERTLKHTQNISMGMADYSKICLNKNLKPRPYKICWYSKDSSVNGMPKMRTSCIHATSILDAYYELYRQSEDTLGERIETISSIEIDTYGAMERGIGIS